MKFYEYDCEIDGKFKGLIIRSKEGSGVKP